VLDQVRAWLDVALRRHLAVTGPEGVPVDEEVVVGRPLAAGQDVLELGRQHRGVVEDEVELQVEPRSGQRLEVGGLRQKVVQPVVDHAEAAVEVAVEHAGEQVQRPERAGDLGTLHERRQACQGAVEAVGVGVQHDAIAGEVAPHRLQVGVVGEQFALFRQDQGRLGCLRVQLGLLQSQDEGREGTVDRPVTGASAAVRQRLRRGAVEQDGHVHALDEVAVAVGPLDDEHAGARDVDLVIPLVGLGAPHALEGQGVGAALEGGDDRIHLVEVDLVRCPEVRGERPGARAEVGREPRVLGCGRRVGVRPRSLEGGEGVPDGRVVGPGVHQPADARVAEDAQAFGVVDGGDPARVVVARQDVGADAVRVERVAEQRSQLGFAHARAAVDGHHGASRGQDGVELLAQGGVQRGRSRQMPIGDVHLVPRHVPGGDRVGIGERGEQGHEDSFVVWGTAPIIPQEVSRWVQDPYERLAFPHGHCRGFTGDA